MSQTAPNTNVNPTTVAPTHDSLRQPHRAAYEPVETFLFDFVKNVENGVRSSIDGNLSSQHYGTIFRIATQSGASSEFPDGSAWAFHEYQYLISKYLRQFVIPSLSTAIKTSNEELLRRYVKCWENFQLFLSLAIFVFSYIDQFYLSNFPFTLQNRAYEIWASELLDPADYLVQDQRDDYTSEQSRLNPHTIAGRTAGGNTNPNQQSTANRTNNKQATGKKNLYTPNGPLYRVLLPPEALPYVNGQVKIPSITHDSPWWYSIGSMKPPPEKPSTDKSTTKDTKPSDPELIRRNKVALFQLDSTPTPNTVYFTKPIKDLLFDAFLSLQQRERAGVSGDFDILQKFTHSTTDLGRLSAFKPNDIKFVLSHYTKLQDAFIAQIKSHYTQEINVAELDFKQYTTLLSRIFAEEGKRVSNYMHTSTQVHVHAVLHDILIIRTLNPLLSKPGSMEYFTSETNFADATQLFNMVHGNDETIAIFAQKLQEFIANIGANIVKDFTTRVASFEEDKVKHRQAVIDAQNNGGQRPPPLIRPDPLDFIQSLLKNDIHFRTLIDCCFSANKAISDALRAASEVFINKEERTVSTHLAEFAGSLCSSRSKVKLSSDKIDLDAITHLFKYLRNKDAFELEYQRLLCARILSGDSLGLSKEQEALQGLARHAGGDFSRVATSLQGDLQTSDKLTRQFILNRQEMLQRSNIDLSFIVCTANSGWALPISQYPVEYSLKGKLASQKHLDERARSQQQHAATAAAAASGKAISPVSTAEASLDPRAMNDHTKLPQIMQDIWLQFGQFYCSQFDNRYLQFIFDDGICEVTFVPEIGKSNTFTLVVTPIMAAILLYLSEQTKFVLWKDLVKNLGIEPNLLGQHLFPLLQPLDNPKKCIVRKSTSTPGLADDDKLILNKLFESTLARISVPFKRKVTLQDKKQQEDQLTGMRSTFIKSIIVRYLKMTKTASHNDVVMQVTKEASSRFQPTPVMIKNVIEEAITEQLLQRNPEDRDKYDYLA